MPTTFIGGYNVLHTEFYVLPWSLQQHRWISTSKFTIEFARNFFHMNVFRKVIFNCPFFLFSPWNSFNVLVCFPLFYSARLLLIISFYKMNFKERYIMLYQRLKIKTIYSNLIMQKLNYMIIFSKCITKTEHFNLFQFTYYSHGYNVKLHPTVLPLL